jgi:hypothetical protein
MVRNNKGWVKIVEAFIGIMLIASVFLIVLNKESKDKDDFSRIHEAEIAILREIQLDNDMRSEILNATPGSNGLSWTGFPNEKVPNYLDCVAKICNAGDLCILQNPLQTDIYSESIIISTTLQATKFDPRKLKLFCWKK